ncbi:hypothetical protein GPALN_010912 [Globodera pallida]|nr:hypothetical protein GPALN_010912 [Globodera pallida]
MCHYFCAILSMLIVAVAVVAHSFPLNVTFESNDTSLIDDTLWSLVNLSSDSLEHNGTIYSAPQATDTLLTITIIVAGCLLLTVLYVLFVDPRHVDDMDELDRVRRQNQVQLQKEDEERIIYMCPVSDHCPYRMTFYHDENAIYIRHSHNHAVVPILSRKRIFAGPTGGCVDLDKTDSAGDEDEIGEEGEGKAKARRGKDDGLEQDREDGGVGGDDQTESEEDGNDQILPDLPQQSAAAASKNVEDGEFNLIKCHPTTLQRNKLQHRLLTNLAKMALFGQTGWHLNAQKRRQQQQHSDTGATAGTALRGTASGTQSAVIKFEPYLAALRSTSAAGSGVSVPGRCPRAGGHSLSSHAAQPSRPVQ